MTVTPIPAKHTRSEYLDLEESAETRHEYWDGEIIEMPGGTPTHNELTVVWNALLWLQLKGKPYKVFGSDLRLWIPAYNTYTYPDSMVVPHPILLQEGRKDAIINPLIVTEVLSESTKAYDLGKKFRAYRSIPTVEVYVLISQDVPHVEQFVRQEENHWLFCEYDGIEATVSLTTLGIEIALSDLYGGVEL